MHLGSISSISQVTSAAASRQSGCAVCLSEQSGSCCTSLSGSLSLSLTHTQPLLEQAVESDCYAEQGEAWLLVKKKEKEGGVGWGGGCGISMGY